MYDYQGQRTVDAFITFLDTGYLAQEIKSNPVPKVHHSDHLDQSKEITEINGINGIIIA